MQSSSRPDMVEAVAIALCEADMQEASDPYERYRRMARAAIEQMRAPGTDAMFGPFDADRVFERKKEILQFQMALWEAGWRPNGSCLGPPPIGY